MPSSIRTSYAPRRCDRSAPPLLNPHPTSNVHVGGAAVVQKSILEPRKGERLDAAALASMNEPALLRDVSDWAPAQRRWSWTDVRRLLAGTVLADVAHIADHHYLVPDARAALDPWVRYHEPHVRRDINAGAVIDELSAAAELMNNRSRACAGNRECDSDADRRAWWRSARRRTVHFSRVPEALRAALEPQAALYATEADRANGQQFTWLSSPGVRTHTHFDSDRNTFVQLLGSKRFVLWPPNQTARLCPFPRLHPLWHKSRVAFEAPDLAACGSYAGSSALVAEVRAGDVLYVPPFWWHTVETLSPSLSLSTISRWPELYENLNGIYGYDYLWDDLHHYEAKAYALRAFVAKLMQTAEAPRLVSDLVASYTGLEALARPKWHDLAIFRRRRRRGGRGGRDGRGDDWPAPAAAEGLGASENGAASGASEEVVDGEGASRGPVERRSGRTKAAACALDERGTPLCNWCLGRLQVRASLRRAPGRRLLLTSSGLS